MGTLTYKKAGVDIDEADLFTIRDRKPQIIILYRRKVFIFIEEIGPGGSPISHHCRRAAHQPEGLSDNPVRR